MQLKTLIALAAIVAASGFAGAQSAAAPAPVPALSVDEAVAKAVSNQPLILQAESSVAAARAKEEQAKSAYLPNVLAEGSYLLLEPQEGIVFGPASYALAPLNIWDFHLGASVLVYDFGKRELQVKLAETGVD